MVCRGSSADADEEMLDFRQTVSMSGGMENMTVESENKCSEVMVRINRQSMRAGLPLDENRADAVGHESDDEANDVSLDDDVCSIGTGGETEWKGENGRCKMNKQEARGYVRVFEHGFASAGNTTCEAGVEVAPRVHFMADESGLKHRLERWGVDVALLVVSSAGETDLQHILRPVRRPAKQALTVHPRCTPGLARMIWSISCPRLL